MLRKASRLQRGDLALAFADDLTPLLLSLLGSCSDAGLHSVNARHISQYN